MKTKKTLRNLLSLTMVFAMILTCGGVSAFADVGVYEDGSSPQPHEVPNVYVDTTGSGNDAVGVEVDPTGNPSAAFAQVTVDDYIVVESGDSAVGIWETSALGEGTAALVGSDVYVSGTANSYGVKIDDAGGGRAGAEVDGDVVTELNPASPDQAAYGVYVESEGKGPAPTVNVGIGGVLKTEASGDATAVGAVLDSYKNGDIRFEAGSISAQSEDGEAVALNTVTGDDASLTVTTTGGDGRKIEAESETSFAYGIVADSKGKTNIQTGDGDVTAKGKSAEAISAISTDGSLRIDTNNVEAISTGTDSNFATGVSGFASGDGQLNMFVNEVKSSANNAVGVDLTAEDHGHVYMTADQIDAVATKTSDGQDGDATGAALTATGTDHADVNLKVEDDIEASGTGVKLDAQGNAGIYVTADNITGGDVGLSYVHLDEDANTFVSVQEVIHGDDVGVLINEFVTADNVEIAVWKIDTVEVDDEEHVVIEENTLTGERSVTDRSRTVEQRIQYLIKVQEDQKDIIEEVDGAELYPFIEEGSVGSATEGTKLTLKKLNLPEGCEVTGAYNGLDGEKVELYKDADGHYYYVVPRGGGVILSVTWDKIKPHGDGGDDWYPGAAWTSGVRYVDITFDFNGGHKPASMFEGPVVKTVPAGTWVVLIEPPVKEGAEFLGWVSDSESVTVSKPGQNFCATEPVLFTASWSDDPVPTVAERNAALIDAIGQSETVIASTEATSPVTADVSAPAAVFSLTSGDTSLTFGDDAAASLPLADLLGAVSSGLNARLVIDLGGGNALEIPVNIQLSLGTPTLVTSSAE